MNLVVTGGTGFIGRHLLAELAGRREATIYVLMREASRDKLQHLGYGARVKPLVGDITRPGLGIGAGRFRRLKGAEVFHLAAVYDLESDEEANRLANVE